jgi:fumarylacetoacetate (FAA) hydrolase
MKLATLREGGSGSGPGRGPGRDGVLVVADDRLSVVAPVPDIAPTLIEALENWATTEPLLREAAAKLEAGVLSGTRPFVPAEMAAPLPRSPQFLDGSVYLRHMEKARKARGAAMPPNYQTEPIMYQGLSDDFLGPQEPMPVPDQAHGVDYEPELAVIVDDVPLGTPVERAASHIKLVVLLNDFTLRALTRTELPKGFGFVQAKPTSSFAAAAVTPDALGAAWDGERFHLRVRSGVNGTRIGDVDAGTGMFFTYPQLIAHAARTRRLSAGTIIGAGAISNEDPASGHGCLAEARIAEEIEFGAPRTPWLRFGDVVWMNAVDPTDSHRSADPDAVHGVFGSIRQPIVPAELPV